MTRNHRTAMQKELTEFFDEDVMNVIHRKREKGDTYWTISQYIAFETGYRIRPETISGWVYLDRKSS